MMRDITSAWRPDAVVLANGSFPRKKKLRQLMNEVGYLACCDAAAQRLMAGGRTPDVIVGDGDSMTAAFRHQYQHLVHIVDEQETNDLTKTVNYVHALGLNRIAILGGTGKREDHTLGNISLLMDYHRQGLDVRMYTDHGLFVPCEGATRLHVRSGQQLSIINFGATGLRAEGLVYPLYDFTNWWQGTLNEAASPTVIIHATGPYLVFVNDD